MGVTILPQFNKEALLRQVRDKIERFEDRIQERLQFIGEDFVKNARENGEYTDRTGNLRNSVGYVILKDGKQVAGAFPGDKSQETKKDEDKSDGVQKAEAMVRRLMGEDFVPVKGFVLIVVAGMDYAVYVEAKGYDVLSASGIKAESDLKKAIERFQK